MHIYIYIYIYFTLHKVYSLKEIGSVRTLQLSGELNNLSSERQNRSMCTTVLNLGW